MITLDSSTRFLRRLTYRTRLIVTGSCFLICLLLFASGYPLSHEGSIMGLPIVLAAWFFKRHVPWLYLIGTMLAIAGINSIAYHSLLWPRSLSIAFLIGSFSLCVEIIIVRFLRDLLDRSEATNKRARLAEQQLALAYEQQRQLNNLKDEFIMSINHELRTPLTEIHGYLELLQNSHTQLDEMTRAIFIDNAAHGCEELKHLVDNVLEVSRLSDNPPPEYEAVAVYNTVHAALRRCDAYKLKVHPIHLSIPEEITVWADKNQLQQIFYNLISNALKYSAANTPVELSAFPVPHQEQEGAILEYLCICVKDVGQGIPPAEIPLLFERFVRLKRDLVGIERGSGLGLYLSKQLVQSMGGTIWAESPGVPGEGSCFFFTLPCVDPRKRELEQVAMQKVQ